MRPDHLY